MPNTSEAATSGAPSPSATKRPGAIRRLYDWTLGWADRPGGVWALFWLSFAESSFFPIPPDVLLMALSLGRPKKALWFATVTTAGSVLGGVAGYFIGVGLFEQIGQPVLEFYGATDKFVHVGELFRDNMAAAILTAGFTPVPYKVFTIAAGAFSIPLLPFIILSAISRGGRFFLVAGLIRMFGPPIKSFIDRYFNILTVVFMVLLIGGFAVLRLATH